MITLEVNGNRYEGWTDISVFRSIETISGSFSFSATSSVSNVFPIKAGAPCSVYVGNTQVIKGYVDTVDVSYDAEQHSISIRGRDITADLVDSTIAEVKEFTGFSLTSIIQKVLSDNNLSDIKVINETGTTLAPFEDYSPSSSPVSQSIFDFIESYARKRQVLLTTDGTGNITISRSSTTIAPVVLENRVNGSFNNIKSATASYNFTDRYNKYTLFSGQSSAGFATGADIEYENVASQKGTSIDSSIRPSRTTQIISNTSDSNQNLAQLATWTKNLAKARSIEYTCTVYNYFQDDAETTPWTPNLLVQVNDDFADISATMLIKSVEYNLSVDGGSTTTLTLVDKDVYTLQSSVDAATAASNNTGSEFKF